MPERLKKYLASPKNHSINRNKLENCSNIPKTNKATIYYTEYNHNMQKKEWENVPIDDVGYFNTNELVKKTDEELLSLQKNFHDTRYSLNGWRNYKNKWRHYLGLDEFKNKKIIDYGCGCGIESLELALHNDLTVADINESNITLAERICKLHGKIVKKELLNTHPPFLATDQKYDVFFSSGVLHHTPFFREILQHITEKNLVDDGIIVLMLYSDKGYEKYTGQPTPPIHVDITKTSNYDSFVRAFDNFGYYADFYTPEKISLKVGDFLKILDYNYITNDDRYCVVRLKKV